MILWHKSQRTWQSRQTCARGAYILKNYKETYIKKFSKIEASKTNVTVQNKTEFCLKSLNHITPLNLKPAAIKVVERILDFIIEHN